MSKRGTEHLESELTKMVDRFRREYEMTYAEVVGTLHVVAFALLSETIDDEQDDHEPDNPDEEPWPGPPSPAPSSGRPILRI